MCTRAVFAPTAMLLLSVLFLSGCRMNEAVYTPSGDRVTYMRPPLAKVVEELDERHLAADTVCASLCVTLRDSEKNKEYQLAGTYLGDKKGNLRLQIKATTGQVVLDMSVFNDQMDVWLPRKNRFFRGNRQDLMNASECQLALLAHIGSARDLFFPRAWTPNAIERRVNYEHGREIISVIEKPGIIRKRSRRLTVAPESSSVELVEVYDRFGRDVGTVAYGDYKMPGDTRPEADALGLLYPNRITLQSHNAAQTLELGVEEIDLNAEISEDKFHVPLPEHQRVMDLDQKLRRSVNLWE